MLIIATATQAACGYSVHPVINDANNPPMCIGFIIIGPNGSIVFAGTEAECASMFCGLLGCISRKHIERSLSFRLREYKETTTEDYSKIYQCYGYNTEDPYDIELYDAGAILVQADGLLIKGYNSSFADALQSWASKRKHDM